MRETLIKNRIENVRGTLMIVKKGWGKTIMIRMEKLLLHLNSQTTGVAPIKNISPSLFPDFHGKYTEDQDELLFEFNILCRSNDYTTSEQKLKLFPSTLKGNSLCWFMSLGGENVTTWDQMKRVFLDKYRIIVELRI